jgi:hypothetical protein
VVRTASGERGEVAACPQRKAAYKSHFELCKTV